jgi:hypothetical protein
MHLKLTQEEWKKFWPSEVEVEAAAHELFNIGKHHGWFRNVHQSRYDELDSIGKEEFEDIVAIILVATSHAKSTTSGS